MEKLLTREEVADYLRLSNHTIYRMADTGRIPASKVGSQWCLRKEDVDQWLEANMNVGGRPARSKQRRTGRRE